MQTFNNVTELSNFSRKNAGKKMVGGRNTVSVMGEITMVVPHPPSPLAYVIGKDGCWEPNITLATLREVTKDKNCIDVGANNGYYTLLLSHLVGDEGKVLSVEPIPTLCNNIEESAIFNSFNNIYVEDCVAFDYKGILPLCISDQDDAWSSLMRQGFETSSRTIDVRADTLDSLTEKHGFNSIDFIKIDAEGSEYYVWAGAQRIIRENPNITIFVEIGEASHNGLKILDEAQSKGFEVGYIDGNGDIRPLMKDIFKGRVQWRMFVIKKVMLK